MAGTNGRTRRERAYDLFVKGFDVTAVAKELHVSRQSAWRYQKAWEAIGGNPQQIKEKLVAEAVTEAAKSDDVQALFREGAIEAVQLFRRGITTLPDDAVPEWRDAIACGRELVRPVVASADSKEGVKGIELLAEIVRALQARPGDDAKVIEYRATWDAQDAEMERRRQLLDEDA